MQLQPIPGRSETPKGEPRHIAQLAAILASGGDARILPDVDGRNQYHATILPSDALAYGSSTISSISAHACATLVDRWHRQLDGPLSSYSYSEGLDILRFKLGEFFGLVDTDIVFTASGTDLEFVGLATAFDGRPLTSVLLGRDEVGSGCIHSAAGRFFADQTATGARVLPQTAIDPVFAGTELVDVPLRDMSGRSRASKDIAQDLAAAVARATEQDRAAIVHVVHGSKSGLTLPGLAELEPLVAEWGDAVTIVVDACQLRISPAMVRRYLALGCVVLLTGSKFAGGPPFSGFALIPAALRERAWSLPAGYRRLALRAEWPAGWPGADQLVEASNFGLLLRLEAAMVELERFAALPEGRALDIAARFSSAVDHMVARLEFALVPGQAGGSCFAASTLRTLDLSARWNDCDMDGARAVHLGIVKQSRHWLGQEIRLGQPVRTHVLADGRTAGTLRLSLSMPMIVELARLPDAALAARFERDMGLVGAAISAAASMELRRPQLARSA